MGKKDEIQPPEPPEEYRRRDGYRAGQVVVETRPAILDEKNEEVSMYEVLSEIRNDVRILMEKLVE